MFDELDAFYKTHTWNMVNLPLSKIAWVYKSKTKADASVECYKTHLITKGFTHEYGIDYEDTFIFTLIPHLTFVRYLLVVIVVRHC